MMKVSTWIKLIFMMLCITLFAACGGGSSTPTSQPTATTSTVSGVISFPASTDRVGAMRAKTTSVVTTITVEVYTLNGVLVASAHPSYDDATRIYSYSIPNLAPNADYVLKVTRGSQVLKKLIGKALATAGTVSGQTVDSVSTAAIIIASQKLSSTLMGGNGTPITLGDALPTGVSSSTISAEIDAAIKPALLEQYIAAAVGTGSSNISATTAGFANVFNLVVTALVENKDPAAVLAGNDTLTGGVPIFVVSGDTVTAPSTDPSTWQVPTSSDISAIVSSSASGYQPPTNTAKSYDDLAVQYLAAQDIANASLNYEKALSVDPTDKEANFGGAITSGMMLIQDPDVTAIVAKWGVVLPTVSQVVQGSSPVKVPFINMTTMPVSSSVALRAKSSTQTATQGTNSQRVLAAFKLLQSKLPQQKTGYTPLAKRYALAPATAPTVSEMQAVIDNVIIPRINTILARLAKIEGQGYSFTVTPAMQGNPLYGTPVVLGDPEFYTLDAALNVFDALFRVATAYHFDLPSGYTYDTISQDPLAMINDPSVFTLKTDGAAKMNAALLNARAAATKAGNAYDAVKTRAAGVGAFDITNWSATDRTDFTNTLSRIKDGLAGPITLTIGSKSVTIDATKLFTNPLTRSKLPTFTYDVPRDAALSAKYGKPVAAENSVPFQWWTGNGYVTQTITTPVTCDIVPSTDIPDYTLNGILPDNTPANNLAGFNALLPVVKGKLVSSSQAMYLGGPCSDGTYIYFLGYDPSQTQIYAVNKLDPSTGTISKLGSYDPNMGTGNYAYPNGLFLINGSFYLPTMLWDQTNMKYTFSIFKMDTTTTPWKAAATPAAQIPYDNYSWPSAITAAGSDVYFIISSFDTITYTPRSDFYKMSGVDSGSPVTNKLFSDTNSSDYYRIAVSGNYIYTNSNNASILKWDMSGNTVAAYATAGLDWTVLVGNNFYGLSDTKMIEYGAIPTGTAQQLSALLRRLF